MAYYNGPPQLVDAQGRRVAVYQQYMPHMQPVPGPPGAGMPVPHVGAVRLVPAAHHPGMPIGIHHMQPQLVPVHIPPGPHPHPQQAFPHPHPHQHVHAMHMHAGPANPTANAAAAQAAAARQREMEGVHDQRPPVDGERFVARYDERGNLFLVSADGDVLLEYPPLRGYDDGEEGELDKEERRRRRVEERKHRASHLTAKRAYREREKELRAEYEEKVKGMKKRMSKARDLGRKMMRVLDKDSSDDDSSDEEGSEEEEFEEGDGAEGAEAHAGDDELEREGTVVPAGGES